MMATANPSQAGGSAAPTTTEPADTGVSNPRQEEAQEGVLAPHEYRMVQRLSETEDVWLVERVVDNHEFVGFRWDLPAMRPQLAGLLARGAGDAVAAVLHHPNLVGYIGLWQVQYWHGTAFEGRDYALMEYCDAGTLRYFIDHTAVAPATQLATRQVLQWLPEGLVWHVATSLLGALAWLHEGVRQEDTIEWVAGAGGAQVATRGMVEQGPMDDTRAEDWMPILHRDIRTDQVFFQHPRGIETYGLCKLGGFGRVFVSGHMHGRALGTAMTTENEKVAELDLRKAVAVAEADVFLARESAMQHDPTGAQQTTWTENYDDWHKGDRPYMKGTEAFKVGAILYQMMTRQTLPDPEECPARIPATIHTPERVCGVRHWDEKSNTPCPRWPSGVFNLGDKLRPLYKAFDDRQPDKGYTDELVDLVEQLLSNYRRTVDTTALLNNAMGGYMAWKETTAEGKLHLDHWDDLVQREKNRRRMEVEEMGTAVRQSGPRAQDYIGRVLGTGEVAQ